MIQTKKNSKICFCSEKNRKWDWAYGKNDLVNKIKRGYVTKQYLSLLRKKCGIFLHFFVNISAWLWSLS